MKKPIAVMMFLSIAACGQPHDKKENRAALDLTNVADNVNAIQARIGDDQHGGPWTVQVPGGALDIGVDTVGSQGPYRQTIDDVRAMLEEPSDGADDYEIDITSSSDLPFLSSGVSKAIILSP